MTEIVLQVDREQILYLISKKKQFITLARPVDAVLRSLLCSPACPP